jgi:hypothetical protein
MERFVPHNHDPAQENMEFLSSVREDVRNDMTAVLAAKRTAEKESLQSAMASRYV